MMVFYGDDRWHRKATFRSKNRMLASGLRPLSLFGAKYHMVVQTEKRGRHASLAGGIGHRARRVCDPGPGSMDYSTCSGMGWFPLPGRIAALNGLATIFDPCRDRRARAPPTCGPPPHSLRYAGGGSTATGLIAALNGLATIFDPCWDRLARAEGRTLPSDSPLRPQWHPAVAACHARRSRPPNCHPRPNSLQRQFLLSRGPFCTNYTTAGQGPLELPCPC